MSGRVGLRLLVAVFVVLALAGWSASRALGADSVYWTDYNSSTGTVRVGNLDGSGSPSSLFTGEGGPEAVALDPSTGKIYWQDYSSGAIRVGNLDGTGTPQALYTDSGGGPEGLAIDPAAGKIYWADYSSGTIRVGNLNGGGASDLFSGESEPLGVAIDPAAGKIYWASNGTGAIRVGNLNGSGTAADLFMSESLPSGVAIDEGAGRIYWANNTGTGAIRVGNLNGSGTPSTLFMGESFPLGVAIDPAAGKIYWANNTGTGVIRVGNLNGSGTPSTLFAGETAAQFPALLHSPASAGAPQLSGGSTVGSVLSCSQGAWASDLLGAFLYRAPRSFAYQWTFNGADITGATSSTYTAPAAGSYACRVTASNQAGSTSQTSASFAVTVAGTPPTTAPPSTTPPKLAHVSQSHRRWRRGTRLSRIASVLPPVGTTFRFTLNEPARVRFAFTQKLPGRRVGGRCVAPTSNNLGKPGCTRTVSAAFSFKVGAGAHTVRFQGRISKHKRLAPGRYTLVITATNSVGQRATAKLTFTIVT
jgi:hypothetical protein